MNIKKQRQNKGISQLKLAFLSKVSKHRIYMAEQGFIKLTEREMAKVKKVFDGLLVAQGGDNDSVS